MKGGIAPELEVDFKANRVAFFFGRHGFLCYIENPLCDHNLLLNQLQNATGKTIKRLHLVSKPPEDFTDCAFVRRKEFFLFIASDVDIPNQFARTLVNADYQARFNTFSDLRLRYLPRNAIAELVQTATPFPKFLNGFFMFPWVDGASLGPGQSTLISDGAYIFFYFFDNIGRYINTRSFERPFMIRRNRTVQRFVPFLAIGEPVRPLAITDIAPNRPNPPLTDHTVDASSSSDANKRYIKGGLLNGLLLRHQSDFPLCCRTFLWPSCFSTPLYEMWPLNAGGPRSRSPIRSQPGLQHDGQCASKSYILFPNLDKLLPIGVEHWFFFIIGAVHFCQDTLEDATMVITYIAKFTGILDIARLAALNLRLAFFVRSFLVSPTIWHSSFYQDLGFFAFSDLLRQIPRFRIPYVSGEAALTAPWLSAATYSLSPPLFFPPRGFSSHQLSSSLDHIDEHEFLNRLGEVDAIPNNVIIDPYMPEMLELGRYVWHYCQSALFDAICHDILSELEAGALEAAELGKLSQKLKNLLPQFQIQQIRAVLLTDNKAAVKIAKAGQDDAIINIFSAAAKRLNMVPKQIQQTLDPADTATSSAGDSEGWTTKGRGRSKSRPRSPSQAPVAENTALSSPNRKTRPNPTNARLLTPCADGWNVPVFAPEDMRYDQSGLCATDSVQLAKQLWEKCKLSTKTIAVLAPKNLAVGHGEPRMMIVPFYERKQGYPTRKIDMQVWLHQLTPNKASFAFERKITDLSATKTQTLVTRARIPTTLIPAAHRDDFAKGYKPIMKLVLAELLDEKSVLLLDTWSPKWSEAFQAYTFFPTSLCGVLTFGAAPADLLLLLLLLLLPPHSSSLLVAPDH